MAKANTHRPLSYLWSIPGKGCKLVSGKPRVETRIATAERLRKIERDPRTYALRRDRTRPSWPEALPL